MKAPAWLSNKLIVGPKLALCTSEKEWRAKLAEMKCETVPQWVRDGADATAHYFDSSDGACAVIVCLGDVSGRTGAEIAGLLVHEAVHVWQEYRRNIGETNPSSEFEAYSIQMLAQLLFEAYAKRIRKARGR